MKFNKLLDNGGMLVSDEVKIILEIEGIQEKKPEKNQTIGEGERQLEMRCKNLNLICQRLFKKF